MSLMSLHHHKTSTILRHVFLLIVLLVCAYPLFWMALTAFKLEAEAQAAPFALPHRWVLKNFAKVFNSGDFGHAYLNSLLICVTSVVVAVVFSACAAFAFALFDFKGRNVLFIAFLLGMMIPVHCVLIPLFVRFAGMGLDNNLWGLILPYLTFSLPTCVYIMTGFFRSIPNELLESACIDGCSIYKTFYSICLPLSKTGLFVTGLMTFIGNWNELLLAMVFIHDDTKKTLPVAVTKFVSPYQTNYEKMFPAILIAIIPSIIVYSMFSNQIVDGLTQGAVKG